MPDFQAEKNASQFGEFTADLQGLKLWGWWELSTQV